MLRKCIFMLGAGSMLFLPSTVFAETIYLKNGQVVTGKIIEKKSFYIMIEAGGAPYKYYTQQIDHIEEDKKEAVPESSLKGLEVPGISTEKTRLILQLMEMTEVISSMEKNLQVVLAQAPDEQKEELKKLFNVRNIIARIIPVYDKYYSEEELKELIEFYRSPLGGKVIEVTPKILTEAAQASLQYLKENQP